MVQIYSDRTATTLKGNGTVAYPVYIVLMNFIKDFQKFIINHEHKIVDLLPISVSETSEEQEMMIQLKIVVENFGETTILLTDDIQQTTKRHEIEKKIEISHTAM